jgi:hypothetical protein
MPVLKFGIFRPLDISNGHKAKLTFRKDGTYGKMGLNLV